ncbi:NAD(P)-binding protein [Exidia glandulosa HHB12029]|uniref:NAD(P)-binding protein n=1 Tax=Exidia glandulosa HHB12029 TaxID=1314781 RepID=A0A165QYU3_EXIGL|nr:NAD(P)-binding protein [Exidia glandulosa HHB12029]
MSAAVVLVTGASRGIGLAVTRMLLEKQHRVVTISRSLPDALQELAAKYPDTLATIRGDVADPAIVDAAVSRFGKLDALILNAGTALPFARIADAEKAPLDAWRAHFETNFFSLVTTLHRATPLLRESNGARVIFVSSGAATGSTGAWGPYNAAKAAMNSLARTFANEEPSITSIAFRPGVVDTEMQGEIRSVARESMKPDEYDRFITLHETGKLASPDVPANVIVRLALEAPKELSGQFISIDGPECAPYKTVN